MLFKSKYILVSILAFSIPFVEFYNSNINRLNFYDVVELFKLFLFIFLIIIILNLCISKIFKKDFDKILFFISICFYFLFFHSSLKEKLPFGTFNSEVAFFLIIIMLLIIYFLIKVTRINYLISTYLIIIFVFNIFFILKTELTLEKGTNETSLDSLSSKFDKLNIVDQNNVYLIILDAATSLDIFENIYDVDIKKEFVNKVNARGYKYVENSIASYNQTELTFASLFHLDYFITDQSPRYSETKNFYPQTLRYNYENLLLIKILQKNNYNFYLFGNSRNKCTIKIETCFNKESINSGFIDIEILKVFFLRTPFIPIFNKVRERIKRALKIETHKENFISNDAIGKFIKITNKKIPRKNFFLIHNYYPHAPFIYDPNCNEKKDDEIITEKNAHRSNKSLGYYENYLCSLKKTLKIIDYLNDNDPNAVVIIQADHGQYFSEERNIFEKMQIFNLVKSPKECESLVDNEIDNVNATRFLLRCGLDIDISLLKKQSYWGAYSTRDENWGKLNKL